jgi:WLM domain
MPDFDSIDVSLLLPSLSLSLFYFIWLMVAIRNVLCHELTHNVHGPHDSNFWSLCKKLEKEVVSLDPFSSQSAHILSNEEYFESQEEHVDGGGWEGGTYTLGGGSESHEGLSRRDILAEAAMRRIQRKKEG